MFICPKCRGKLNISESGAAVCEMRHSFDRSREGYYNLLLGSGGGQHGDNAEMINARREFLSRGYYQPLAERIAELASEFMKEPCALLDAGCGEGYYTEMLVNAYSAERVTPDLYAFDISKSAVKRAVKRIPEGFFAVASSYAIPMPDSSVDLLLNTFSPLALNESARVLKQGGIFIMAIPAEDHLFELKAKIYDNPYKNEVADTSLCGFTLLLAEPVRFSMHFAEPEDIRSLFMMTPYAYRTGASGRARVAELEKLDCTADFLILVYKKD